MPFACVPLQTLLLIDAASLRLDSLLANQSKARTSLQSMTVNTLVLDVAFQVQASAHLSRPNKLNGKMMLRADILTVELVRPA